MPKKCKKSKNKTEDTLNTRELIFKEDMQEYAKILRLLGDRRLEVLLADGETSLARIPGQLKRCKIKLDDVVLISRRDFQEGKVDVIHKYTEKEIKNLISYNEIPVKFGCASSQITDEIQSDIIFDNNDVEEEIDFDDI